MQDEHIEKQDTELQERLLDVMDVVERQLGREKHEASLIICTLLAATCLWTLLCQLWEYLGRPISDSAMTVGIELLGVGMLLFILRSTHFRLTDMGLNLNRIRRVMLHAAGVSVVPALIMIAIKWSIVLRSPGTPFAAPRKWYTFLTYMLTATLQEFLCRGVTQECLSRIFTTKHNDLMSIMITSLFFCALHMYYGFLFMLGAGALSAVLGIIYKHDRNIWGLSLIHYVLGLTATMLFLG